MSESRNHRARAVDARAIALASARLLAILLPPLFAANVLLAAPKKITGSPAKRVTPAAAPKVPADAGFKSAVDAAREPKESTPKIDASPAEPREVKTKREGEEPEISVKQSERKEGDASVKVFEFGSVAIEGRTRWPSVTYFTRRMRAEFETQKLPHRPFLSELEASKADPAVK
ncbi:MAG: hypothetical protein NVS3B20_25790 [Polyangiales bacterium]